MSSSITFYCDRCHDVVQNNGAVTTDTVTIEMRGYRPIPRLDLCSKCRDDLLVFMRFDSTFLRQYRS